MKKQTTAFLIAAGMILSMGSAAGAATNDHFAASAFKHLVQMEMMKEEATATPNAVIERKEMKDLIQKAVGKPVADKNESAKGVTRVEVAEWIASSLPAMNTGINGHNMPYPYKDTANVTAEQKAALHQLYKLGIMVGDGKGNFGPSNTLTRGEAAVLLDNVIVRSVASADAVSFETLSEELPETVYTLVNENKFMPGVSSVEENGFVYVIVSGGEQPHSGYSVKVNKVSETDAGIFVDASLQGPDPDKMYAQIISYPVQVVKIKANGKVKPVYKVGQMGEEASSKRIVIRD